jgi:hypothetical protein
MRGARALTWTALVLAPLALSGCGGGGVAGGLRAAGVAGTPDEFMVLPTRPLEMPQDLSALPPPTPGVPNRVDLRPHQQAIAGLTGRPAPATANGAALVAAAGPRDPGIRAELAVDDATWRATHRGLLFERMFSKDKVALVYQPMVLDAPAEFERMRASGVRTPAAPPRALEQ